jgi:hypothetical protein
VASVQCELQKSGFKEDITVYFDAKQKLMGVSYSTPASTVARECDSTKVEVQWFICVRKQPQFTLVVA